MRFIGCKTNLLDEIKNFIAEHCENDPKVFCDLFAGTGAVSRFFKEKFCILSNDLLYFSYLLNAATIENQETPFFSTLKKHGIAAPFSYLEKTKIPSKTKSFITETYSPAGTAGRMYLTEENAQRIDFIRTEIENWNNNKLINYDEYIYLLAALIEGIPFVSNITGTYGAYLKHWDKRAFKPFEMQRLAVFNNERRNRCFNKNATDLISSIEGDILYLDPPYNARQYLPNYHLLETVARYDNPVVAGVTGTRPYNTEKSDFCLSAKVEIALKTIIQEARFKHIIMSYSDDGLLSREQIINILKTHCDSQSVILKEIPYNRYKGKLKQEKTSHSEFLFYARKNVKDSMVYFSFNSAFAQRKTENGKSFYESVPATNAKREFIKSPMNYIGGKHRLLPQIFSHFPKKIKTFLEPFAGGFNVSVNLPADTLRCNDMNYKVVEMVRLFCYAEFDFVLNRIEEKICEYALSPHNEKGYNAFRDFYNATGNPIDLFTNELKIRGEHLGGSRRPDGILYNTTNGVILDMKAYAGGFSLPISEQDKMNRYLEENKRRDIEQYKSRVLSEQNLFRMFSVNKEIS